MFLLTQLAASYKSPFSVARDQTDEEPGTLWWSLPASLWYAWIRYKWKHKEKWMHLLIPFKNVLNPIEKNSWWGVPCQIRALSGSRWGEIERASLPQCLLTRGACEVTAAAAALPQRPSERSLFQLSAVNSRRKTGKTQAWINRCGYKMKAQTSFFSISPPLWRSRDKGGCQEHFAWKICSALIALLKQCRSFIRHAKMIDRNSACLTDFKATVSLMKTPCKGRSSNRHWYLMSFRSHVTWNKFYRDYSFPFPVFHE